MTPPGGQDLHQKHVAPFESQECNDILGGGRLTQNLCIMMNNNDNYYYYNSNSNNIFNNNDNNE